MYKASNIHILNNRIIFFTRRAMSVVIKYDEKSIKSILPSLDNSKYKGQCGRIGVVGGSREYTGAPYFAGISALRCGSDLVHIFCTESAGIPIKCYSPELIVHPILDDEDVLDQVNEWFPRLHAVLVGPGLGRDPQVLKTVKEIISLLKCAKKPLIIDADGLHLVTLTPYILVGAENITLTPNQIEFKRLCDSIEKIIGTNVKSEADLLAYFGPGVTIVQKGSTDKIFNQEGITAVEGGSLCRCGGQGDVLSGSIAIFTHWAHEARVSNPSLFGAFCGCTVTKRLSKIVFDKLGRSMVAGDLIPAIPDVLKQIESR